MIKLILIVVGIFIFISTEAQEKRNLLTDNYTRKFVIESLCKDFSWIKYPSYYDREKWNSLSLQLREETIKDGEKFMGYKWPVIAATEYLEFTRTGNRAVVDQSNDKRRKALESLVMAELLEGKGRFIDDIINGVFSTCEQTYWGCSAHFYMYGFNDDIAHPIKSIPDIEDPIIDLVVADMAADLSWIYHFFREEFDKISPVISKRLKYELQRKVLDPYYERYDYWWITGWGEGKVNNWNPWCNYNVLTCILLIEDDLEKKQNAIYKSMESVDLFVNSYPEDGGCDEGPSYWGMAGGKLFDYLDLLKSSTNGEINVFSNELIKNIGRYIYRVYVGNSQYYINYSDAPFRIKHNPGRIFRYGNVIGDETMKGFGVSLINESNFGEASASGRIGESLEDLFNTKWKNTRPIEPLISEYYFSDLDIALGRDKSGTTNGFYFAAKGGSNGEGHNHNDVGSFMLYFNGDPVLIDIGVGTYSRKTFSSQRYEIWTMQSDYHNVPVINGFSQSPGGQFKAKGSKYISTKHKVAFSTDITNAYPSEANVNKWLRSYTLERGRKFSINDSFQLTENNRNTSFHFMTGLRGQILKPGILKFEGDDFILHLKYNSSKLNVNIEEITIKDRKLLGRLGEKISRIVFELKGNNLVENISFEITEIK